MSSALQTLQTVTISVARAVWCGSGVIADGKTEYSGAEVAHGLVCFAACGYSEGLSTAMNTNVLVTMPKDPACPVRCRRWQIAINSVARAVWCGSGVIVDGKTKYSGAEVVHGLVCVAACGC